MHVHIIILQSEPFEDARVFPELRAAKHLDVLRNSADKEQSLERNKRMSNKEQQTQTRFISVWYKCVTMSGWNHQPYFSYNTNDSSLMFHVSYYFTKTQNFKPNADTSQEKR